MRGGQRHEHRSFLIQLLVNGLVVGTLYGVVAMSFVLIYKATQVVNFAQGELLLVGAWVCWALLTKYQVPFWLGMPITLVFMFIFGIAIQVLILRPMIGEPIISVDHGDDRARRPCSRRALKWIFGVNPQPFPRVFQSQSVNILGLQMQTVYHHEPCGLARDDDRHGLVLPRLEIRACDARHRVQSAGRAVARHFRQNRIRDGLGDLGDGLGGRRRRGRRRQRRLFRACRPTASRCFRRRSSAASISIGGAVLGGIIIGLLENIAQYVDSQYLHWGNLYEIAPFYVLIIILMIKPYGLFGTKDIERV